MTHADISDIKRKVITPLAEIDTAKRVISLRWRVFFAVTIVSIFILSFALDEWFGSLIMGLAIVNFAFLLSFRLRLIPYPIREPLVTNAQDFSQNTQNSQNLPKVSVLLPMKNEGAIIAKTLAAVAQLDYPVEQLEVIIIVEKDDDITLQSLKKCTIPRHFQVRTIERKPPFTKGRGMQEMLSTLRGKYCTIFDAESKPEPLQVRKAVHQLESWHDNKLCVQAIIAIENPSTNTLTKFFAGEYLEWFYKHLTRNTERGLPIGLAGNSFYLSTKVLREVGGWDPYNVTEDADLSVRLTRNGVEYQRLESLTFEPCPDTFTNWLRQRVRWNKGLLLTKMIHLGRAGFGLREMSFRQWFSFWSRMLCGSLVPFFMLHAFVLGTYYAQTGESALTKGINFVLACNFFVSLAVSMTSDYRHFKHLKVKISLWELFYGTLLYWTLYLIAGFWAYYEYIVSPLQWNKTDHDSIINT